MKVTKINGRRWVFGRATVLRGTCAEHQTDLSIRIKRAEGTAREMDPSVPWHVFVGVYGTEGANYRFRTGQEALAFVLSRKWVDHIRRADDLIFPEMYEVTR